MAVNFAQLAIQKVKDVASSLGKTINTDVQNVGNYFNPTSNGGQNFWSTPVAQGLGNVQRVTQAAQNVPTFNFAQKATSGIQNPALKFAAGIPLGMAEGMLNTPSNYVKGIAQFGNYTGNALGQDLRGGNANYNLITAGSKLAPTAESILNVATLGGGAEALNQVGKQTLKQTLIRGAAGGAKYGAIFGALGGLEQTTSGKVGDLAKNVAVGAITNAAVGSILGGSLSGLGYGWSKFADTKAAKLAGDMLSQKQELGVQNVAEAKQLVMKKYLEANPNAGTIASGSAPDGMVSILAKRDWKEPGLPPAMQDAIKLSRFIKASEAGLTVSAPPIGMTTKDVSKEVQAGVDAQAGLTPEEIARQNFQKSWQDTYGNRPATVKSLTELDKTNFVKNGRIPDGFTQADMVQATQPNVSQAGIGDVMKVYSNDPKKIELATQKMKERGDTIVSIKKTIDSRGEPVTNIKFQSQPLSEVKTPSSTISQEVPTGKLATKGITQPPQAEVGLSQPIIPSDTQSYIDQMRQQQNSARNVNKDGITPSKFLADVKRKLVDSMAPIEDILGSAQKKGGYKILPKNDISLQVDRAIRSRELAGMFLKDNGMVDVIKQAPNLDALDQYLIAKHAVEVTTTTGRNVAADAKLVQDLAPVYEPFAQKVTQFGGNLLDYITKSGLISEDLSASLKKQYPNYVPINRILSEMDKTSIPEGAGVKGPASLSKQTVVQKLKGSEKPIDSPIKSLLTKTVDAFDQGERNQAGQMLASYKDLPGNPFQIKEVGSVNGKLTAPSNVTFSYLDNGVKKTLETTPEIAQAAKFLDKRQLGFIGNILATPVRVARVGITGVNIPFVATNVAKDQVTATINSDHALSTSIANPGVFLKSIWNAVGHGAEYDAWIRDAGGGTSFDISRSAPEVSVAQIRATRNLGTQAVRLATHPWEILRSVENIINRGEELTRLQQYTGTKEALLKEGRTPQDAALLAAKASRENTVNFGRSGDWGKALNSVLLYVNAGIQGSRTLMRNLTTRPIQTSAKIALTVFLPVATVTAWNMSDPQRKAAYTDIRDFEKENNLVIVPPNPQKDPVTGKWNVIKIPFSQEIANLTIPVRKGIEAIQGSPGPTFGDISMALLGTATSLNTQSTGALVGQFIPQAVKPPLEGFLNKNLFSGTDIVPQYINGQLSKTLPPSEQAYTNTSGTAREIGKLFNVSPLKVEQFIKSSLGGVGSQILNASDTAQAKAGIIPQEQVGGQSIIQGLTSRFALATGGQELANLFDSVDKANNTGDITNLDMNQRAIGNGKMYYPDKTLNTKTGKMQITVKSVNAGNAVQADKILSTTPTYTYQDSSGTYHEIDISKITSLPSSTPYEKAVKENKAYTAVSNILDNLDPTQQAQALQQLGITPEDAAYYNIARQSTDLKDVYVTDEISRIMAGTTDRGQMLNYLVSQRKEVNGNMILANGVVDQLYQDQIISKDEATQLKNLTIKNGVPKTKLTGRGKKVTIKKVANAPAPTKITAPKIKTMTQLLTKSGKIRTKRYNFISKIKA